jgi:hypothetical protein
MTNKTLLIVLILLLGVYGLTRIFSGKKEKSFKTELIQIDTARVTAIVITTKNEDGEEEEITLKREEPGWIASNGRISVSASPAAVTSALGSIGLIRTKQIAAKKPDKWADYEVEDGQGTRVRVFGGDKLLEDFIIGRFHFNPQTQTAVSYLRLNGENEVYAVDGLQTMTLGQQFAGYRERNILKMQREMEVTGFSWQFPDTLMTFEKTETGWVLNGETLLDSMKVENYLNVLRNISSDEFADDFDDALPENYEQSVLSVTGVNIPSPFTITVYRDESRPRPFVIRSSQNTEAYFASDSTGVYQRLFKPMTELLND